MPEKIFFQTSLPRSGSTVFQNIMNQDERFYASATSGLLELLFAARANFTQAEEFRAQDPELMKTAFMGFCREGMRGYYEAITDKRFVIDKSRGHSTLYDFIHGFYPDPKMICFVRNLEDIIASMEKLFRKNQHLSSPIVNHGTMQGTTTPKRVDIWFSSPPVGLAVERLSEVIRQGIDRKILFIKYESFCLYPESEIKRIYEFLEVDPVQHDLSNIMQITQEDDSVYGIPGLHTIRPKLEMMRSDAQEVLGKDVCDWIKNRYKWFYDYFGYQ